MHMACIYSFISVCSRFFSFSVVFFSFPPICFLYVLRLTFCFVSTPLCVCYFHVVSTRREGFECLPDKKMLMRGNRYFVCCVHFFLSFFVEGERNTCAVQQFSFQLSGHHGVRFCFCFYFPLLLLTRAPFAPPALLKQGLQKLRLSLRVIRMTMMRNSERV